MKNETDMPIKKDRRTAIKSIPMETKLKVVKGTDRTRPKIMGNIKSAV
jgi:hypothetical protein